MKRRRKSKASFKNLLRDSYIKFTPTGVIVGKGGKHISFEGESGKFMQAILKNELANISQENVISKLVNCINELNIRDSYYIRLQKIKSQKILLFLSRDNIGKKIKEIFEQIGIKSFSVTYFPFKEIPESVTMSDSVVIYHYHPQNEVLFEINKLIIKNNKKLIRAYREINSFIIAPFIIPHETACYRCYTILKKSNRIYDYDTLTKEAIIAGKITQLPSIIATFCAYLFVIKIIRFLGGDIHFIEELYETVIDLNNFNIEYNQILKLPNCPDCGSFEKC